MRNFVKLRFKVILTLFILSAICINLYIVSYIYRKTTKSVAIIATQKNYYYLRILKDQLKADGHSVKIYLLPKLYIGKLLEDVKYTKEQLSDPDTVLPCKKDSNNEYNLCSGIEDDVKYVIVENPYSTDIGSPTEKYDITKLSKKYKVLYLPYATYSMYIKGMVSKEWNKIFYKIFADSESGKYNMMKYGDVKGSKIEVTTLFRNCNQKCDQIENNDFDYTILYTPRWYNSKEGRERFEPGSTFLEYYKYLYNYALNHKKVRLIIRPHPLLKRNFVENKFLTENEVNKIFTDFKKLDNVEISENNIEQYDVCRSDIVISDLTAFLHDVLYLKKDMPIIYLSNGAETELNKDKYTKIYRELFHIVYHPRQIEEYIEYMKERQFKRSLSKKTKKRVEKIYKGFNKNNQNPNQILSNFLLYD